MGIGPALAAFGAGLAATETGFALGAALAAAGAAAFAAAALGASPAGLAGCSEDSCGALFFMARDAGAALGNDACEGFAAGLRAGCCIDCEFA